MTPLMYEWEAELALRAVSTGGEIALAGPDGQRAWTKESNRDIATETDRRIESHIRAVLAPSGHLFLGEETAPTLAAGLPDAPVWAVDPIDGTVNWLSGLPYYAVSVGLLVKRNFVVGAVALPADRELFFTHGDGPAFLNGRTLRPPPERALSECLVAASFASGGAEGVSRQAQYDLFGQVDAESRGCLRLGSAASNICNVAAGRLQAAYGANARIWDVAGALAIAQRAGLTLYVGLRPDTLRVDYVVGGRAAASALRDLALGSEILRLEEVSS